MLETEIVYDCKTCDRFWLFKEYSQHYSKKQCKKDASAFNHVEKIKLPISAADM
jgi:hypothetical protein